MLATISILVLIVAFSLLRIRANAKKELERLEDQKRGAEVLLKALEQPKKKTNIEKGYSFMAPIGCNVLGTFYEQDEKYCVVCPGIDNLLIPLPFIGRINDKNKIVFGAEMGKEILIKSRDIYQGFKTENKDKFLDMGEM